MPIISEVLQHIYLTHNLSRFNLPSVRATGTHSRLPRFMFATSNLKCRILSQLHLSYVKQPRCVSVLTSVAGRHQGFDRGKLGPQPTPLQVSYGPFAQDETHLQVYDRHLRHRKHLRQTEAVCCAETQTLCISTTLGTIAGHSVRLHFYIRRAHCERPHYQRASLPLLL
jgi:hypothetical protein